MFIEIICKKLVPSGGAILLIALTGQMKEHGTPLGFMFSGPRLL
jgi:hypothetical protein